MRTRTESQQPEESLSSAAMQKSSLDRLGRVESPPRRRLLTAEDNDDLRAVMQAVLELHGFHVTACVDGEDAESVYIKQQPFDLLVTDLEMPRKSGADLAASLCRRNPSLPVLIVSGANVDAGQLQEFTSNGWTFISKPFDIPNLINQIKALLATSGAPTS